MDLKRELQQRVALLNDEDIWKVLEYTRWLQEGSQGHAAASTEAELRDAFDRHL